MMTKLKVEEKSSSNSSCGCRVRRQRTT